MNRREHLSDNELIKVRFDIRLSSFVSDDTLIHEISHREEILLVELNKSSLFSGISDRLGPPEVSRESLRRVYSPFRRIQ